MQRRCSVDGCPDNAHARGLCRKHYGRLWRGKDLDAPVIREVTSLNSVNFTLASIERQIRDARRNHDLVVGFDGKMRWVRILRELEAQRTSFLKSQSKLRMSCAAG